MVVDKDKWLDFEDGVIDLLVTAYYYGGPFSITEVSSDPQLLLDTLLFNRISIDRATQKVYATALQPAAVFLGSATVSVELSSFGEAVYAIIPSFRKAIALYRLGCVEDVISFIYNLQLSELGVFLSHSNERIREAAKIRFDFLISQGGNFENVDGFRGDNV